MEKQFAVSLNNVLVWIILRLLLAQLEVGTASLPSWETSCSLQQQLLLLLCEGRIGERFPLCRCNSKQDLTHCTVFYSLVVRGSLLALPKSFYMEKLLTFGTSLYLSRWTHLILLKTVWVDNFLIGWLMVSDLNLSIWLVGSNLGSKFMVSDWFCRYFVLTVLFCNMWLTEATSKPPNFSIPREGNVKQCWEKILVCISVWHLY